MNVEDFEQHLQNGESTTVEFKRCGNKPGQDTFETICSFGNRLGGSIFLGVEDDGTVVGIGSPDADEVKRNVINVANNPRLFDSLPSLEFEDIDYHGKKVIRIWVPADSAIHRFKGTVYDRVFDEDVRIVGETQIAALYLRKQGVYTEQRIYPYLLMTDLRLDLLPRVRQLAAVKRADHPWINMDDEELLRSAKLYGRDFQTGQEGLTMACAMLLGTDEVIASIAPAYVTDAIVRLADVDRYDDRLTVRTNLVEAYDQLCAFCAKHLPDPFYLEGSQAISARDIVVRELVANILVHREFTNPFPAKLIIDKEGLRTENASRTLLEGRITLADFNPMPKNPIIASFFGNIGRAEALGSGTRNIFRYAVPFLGAEPKLIEGDIFKASIPDAKGLLSGRSAAAASTKAVRESKRVDVRATIERLLVENDTITIAQVAESAGVTKRTASTYLQKMLKEGAIRTRGTTKDRQFYR